LKRHCGEYAVRAGGCRRGDEKIFLAELAEKAESAEMVRILR
jgi:hypothetical protein